MSKISRHIVLLCMLFLSFGLTRAQEGYPLPNPLPVISAENAAQITQLAQIGGALSSGLGWSPDGQVLAVGLTDSVLLYDINDFSQPYLTLNAPGFSRFEMDGGRLVVVSSSNQRWDAQTGERIPKIAPTSPSGRVAVNVSSSAVTLTGDGAPVTLPIAEGFLIDDLIFSPDETHAILVTTATQPSNFTQENDFSLWDVKTGALVSELNIMRASLEVADFMMDGQKVVVFVSSMDPYGDVFEELRVWDAITGELIPLPYTPYNTSTVRLSADKQLLAFHTTDSNDGEGRIVVWSGQEIGEIRSGIYSSESYARFEFTPDGRNLVVQRPEAVSVWEVVSFTPSDEQPGLVEQLVITNPDQALMNGFRLWSGGVIVTGANRWTTFWDLPSGENRLTYQASEGESVTAIHPQLTQMLISQYGGTESFIRDVQTGQVVAQFPSDARINTSFTQAAYWDNGKVVVTVIEAGETIEISPFISEIGGLASVNFLSERVLFRQLSGEVNQYDLVTGEATPIELSGNRLNFQIIDNGEPFVIYINRGSSAVDPTTSTFKSLENPSKPEMTFPTSSNVRISADGQFFSVVSGGCSYNGGATATLWDAKSGQIIAEESGQCGPHSHLFTPNGRWWVVGTDTGFLLYDLDALSQDTVTQPESLSVFTPEIGGIYDITISADGQVLAARAYNFPTYSVKVYRFADLLAHTSYIPPEPLFTFHMPNEQKLNLSPDGRWLVTEQAVFEVASGTAYPRPAGERVAFSPDGTLAAFAGDGVLSSVSLTDEPTLLHTLPVMAVRSVGFSPDGTRLYAADFGRVRVFGVPPR